VRDLKSKTWLNEHLENEAVQSYLNGEWKVLSITLAAYKGEKKSMKTIAESKTEGKAPCGCIDPRTCCN
jgi:hypothetical protein